MIPEMDRLLKGWDGHFHQANSTRVFDQFGQHVALRLQR